MKLTHAAIYTFDLERLKNFYTTYFGGTSNKKYSNKTGLSTYFITFDDGEKGARLELMTHTDLTEHTLTERENGIAHLAFSVGSKEAVLALTERITADGYPLYSAPRITGDDYFESCIGDPDGNRIEITI